MFMLTCREFEKTLNMNVVTGLERWIDVMGPGLEVALVGTTDTDVSDDITKIILALVLKACLFYFIPRWSG